MQNSPQKFTQSLESWYKKFGRDLPWRHTENPYHIWISEIMLQQTQVDRVKTTFYPRFLEKFPDINSLASSEWDSVYPVWRGLGYYNRGKNLLKAAQVVVKKHEGIFPKTEQELFDLPGIGKYTASAILAFAYDKKIPAIDTNIRKILSVLWPGQSIEKKAKEVISYTSSGRLWNNAMMDLATALRSGQKIEGSLAQFFPNDIARKFIPVRKKPDPKKKKRKHVIEVGIACIYKDGKYLIQSRPKGKTFEGMWEFPGGKREKGEDLRHCVKREIKEELGVELSVRPFFFEETHTFEKVDLRLCFHRCQIQKGTPKPMEGQQLDWVSPADFDTVQFLDTNGKALAKLKTMRV
jgi:A/G-specific adenine glycosylase